MKINVYTLVHAEAGIVNQVITTGDEDGHAKLAQAHFETTGEQLDDTNFEIDFQTHEVA